MLWQSRLKSPLKGLTVSRLTAQFPLVILTDNVGTLTLQLAGTTRVISGDFSVSVATPVTAQEIEACSESIVRLGQSGFQSWRTDDNTFYSPSWSYDPTACTSRITFSASRLYNNVGERVYNCQIPSFDGSGTFTSVCDRQTK